MNIPTVTICIVNYNGLKYLKECFDSIAKSDYPFEKIETIMVDNASTDGSVDYVRTHYPWVKVLALDKNYGFAKANNVGAKTAQGEYIVFLNNDTVVTPFWLNELVNILEKDKRIGVAGSKLLLLDTPEKLQAAGSKISFTGVGYDIGFLDDNSEKYNSMSNRGYVCAAAMIVRKEEFLDFGGFDENYFMYSEDVDLCWRYWLYGKQIVYVPKSVVYHKFRGTSGELRHTPLKVFCGTRNSLFNTIKNYETHNMLLPLSLSFLYHILKTLYFIVRLKFSLALSMIRAYCSFLRYMPKMISKRREVQSNRKIRDRYLFDNSLIGTFSDSFKEFLCLLKV